MSTIGPSPRESQGISVIVIAQDEEEMIAGCLESLRWADEVIVVDGGSRDSTAAIARAMGARVYEVPWPGYAKQRNNALRLGTCPWVLFVDADERVPRALAQEIGQAVESRDARVGYRIPFRNFLYGQETHWGIWKLINNVRLVRKDAAVVSPRPVDEVIQVNGPVGQLRQRMVHISHRTVEHELQKLLVYSRLNAEHELASGAPRMTPWQMVRRAVTVFWECYVTWRGFRDGAIGFLMASFHALMHFCAAARVWEAQREQRARHRPVSGEADVGS